MTPRALFLLSSLAVNAALIAVLLIPATPPSAPSSSFVTEVKSPTTTPPVFSWPALSDGSDVQTVARLRAEGFPPSVIRVITENLLKERFASRYAAVVPADTTPYWRDRFSSDRTIIFSPASIDQRRAYNRDYLAAQEELLGPDAWSAPEAIRRRQANTYGDLPSGKSMQLDAINQDYIDLRIQVQNETHDIVFPEDQEKYDLIERERRADIVKLLSPAELEAYDLRSSPAASRLRGQLSAFDPSEEEFKAVYRAQQNFIRQNGSATLPAAEARRLRDSLVGKALTPDRFADYQLKGDGYYSKFNDFVQQQQLPATTTSTLVRLQQEIADQLRDLKADTALSTEEKSARRTALASVTEAKLVKLIGPIDDDTREFLSDTVLYGLPSPSTPTVP